MAEKIANEEYNTYRTTESKDYTSDFDREMKRLEEEAKKNQQSKS